MRTIEEIKSEIEYQKSEMEVLIMRRDQYLRQGNEFAFNLMNESLAKVLAKIEALSWVVDSE